MVKSRRMTESQAIKKFETIIKEGVRDGLSYGDITKKCAGPVSKVLKNKTQFLDEIYKAAPNVIRIYCILENIDTVDKVPVCEYCKNKKVNIVGSNFSRTCSAKCAHKLRAIETKGSDVVKQAKKKRKATMLSRYNVDSVSKIEEVKEKKKQTALKNYGSLKAAYHDTAKKTVQEKYGVDNVSQLDEIKQKKIETSRENYGTDYPWQSEKGKAEQKQAVQEKYGVDNVSQLIEVHQKKLETGGHKYITPSGKEILYEGRERLYLDHIYSKIDEKHITPQPKMKIKYLDENLKEHYWFPDVKIDIDGKTYLIELKDITILPLKNTRIIHRLYNAILQGYESHCILYYGNNLYKINLFDFNNKHWILRSINGSNIERIKEMLLKIEDFDIIDIF